MPPKSCQPFEPARRPGGKPHDQPRYRVLVHRKFAHLWQSLAERVGEENAHQFWDHVAWTPGEPARIGSTTILRGKAGKPRAEGWSRTIHYEITGAGRIDYQYHNAYRTTPAGDDHPVVFILTIDLSSH